MTRAFSIARFPRIEFGAGGIEKLPRLAARYGRTLLLVTGVVGYYLVKKQ